MRLDIKGLYGRFDYDISFEKNGITIDLKY